MLAGYDRQPSGRHAADARRARDYVIDQLKLYGYEVRVQDTDARRPELGLTARVSNMIARPAGQTSRSDRHPLSLRFGPEIAGRADDGFGVAVSLEAARLIAARPRPWSTFVLVTDGEEVGLMGAAALVTDREVATGCRPTSTSSPPDPAGPAMLFETGPGNSWLTRRGRGGAASARRIVRARDLQAAAERHRLLHSARHDIPGLNFATVGDSYAYHTARDTPERLARARCEARRERRRDRRGAAAHGHPRSALPRDATYFDIGGTVAISFVATGVMPSFMDRLERYGFRIPNSHFLPVTMGAKRRRYELTPHKYFFVLSCCLIDRYSFYAAHGGARYTAGANQKTFDNNW